MSGALEASDVKCLKEITKIKLTHLKLSIPLKTWQSLGWLWEVSMGPLYAEAECRPEPVVFLFSDYLLHSIKQFLLKVKHL